MPIPTNVYTIFQPFYRDFGYWGIAVFAAIYGIIMGMTYRYSKNGNSFFICLYTYFFSLIVLQFYQEKCPETFMSITICWIAGIFLNKIFFMD